MTDQPTPETDDFRPCHLTPSDWPWFARGMEIERDALRADVARLRTALEGMLIAEMEVRQMDGFSADEVEAEPHWMAARAALDTPAK